MPPDHSSPPDKHDNPSSSNPDDPRLAATLNAVSAVIKDHGLEKEAMNKIAEQTDPASSSNSQSTQHTGNASKDQEEKPSPSKTSAPKGGTDKKQDQQQDGPKEPKDDQDDESNKKMPPEKKRRLILIGVLVGIIVIIACITFWLYSRQYETTDDAFIDGHISQISPQASGRIQNLLVDDNQQVEEGQLLAEIDPRDYQEKLDQAYAQHTQAVAQVELQKANVIQAEANVETTEADVFQADQDLTRYQAVDPKAITRQQLDNAIANSQSAHAKLDANIQAVEAAKAQVAAAEANVQQTDVDINNAKLQLSYCKITSPIKGRITRRTVEVGNVVSSGTPLLAVVSNDLWVTANYKETQLDHMHAGQKVRLQIDAFPDIVFWGHVDSFQKGSGSVFSTLPAENATGNFVKVVQRVPVKIVFDNPDQRDQYPLAPGLSVDPRVTVR